MNMIIVTTRQKLFDYEVVAIATTRGSKISIVRRSQNIAATHTSSMP